MQFKLDFSENLDPKYNSSKRGAYDSLIRDSLKVDIENYFGVTAGEAIPLNLGITSFVEAVKCPKLFIDTTNLGVAKRTPIYFKIGSLFDGYAKKFIHAQGLDRIKQYNEIMLVLPSKLRSLIKLYLIDHPDTQAINKLKIEEFIAECVNAFNNFCQTFKDAISPGVENKAYKQLYLHIKNLDLRGKIDLLILNKSKDKFVLIDLKLKKFGTSIEEFKLPDVVQILLYAHALENLKIPIDSVGFYYIFENELVLEKFDYLKSIDYIGILNRLSNELSITKKLEPKKCELCLMCPLKKKCSIGKDLTVKDFAIPLLL